MRSRRPSLILLLAASCSGSPREVTDEARGGIPTSSESAAAPSSATTSSAPSGAPTTASVPATDEALDGSPSVELLPPDMVGSMLESVEGFDAVRKGKVLGIGAKGPAVTVVQTMLLAWGYPLSITDVTGRFDERTAVAVLHFRIDFELSRFKGSGEAEFAKAARIDGKFDDAALKHFGSRLRAKSYRWIREIDLTRGLRFEVPAGTTSAAALAAIFPDERSREKANALGAKVEFDPPSGGPTAAGWISIRAYACATSPRQDCSALTP